MPPSLPARNIGAVEAQVTGVENSVDSVVHPDGNMASGFELNFIEIFRLPVRFWY
jgi:hypothetical protein